GVEPPMPMPIPKPPRAEEVLVHRRRIAARYPVRRRRITGRMIAEVGGVNLATAGQIRQWAGTTYGLWWFRALKDCLNSPVSQTVRRDGPSESVIALKARLM